MITTVSEMYDQIADANEVINDIFSIQVFFFDFHSFIFKFDLHFLMQISSVIFLAVLLEIIAVQLAVWISFFHRELNVCTAIEHTVFFAMPITWKFLIIHACSLCSKEAKKLNILIDRQLNNYTSDIVYKKLNALLSKMKLRKIVLNTGIFDISWKMILPIFTTITTYIVIIIQFTSPKA